MFENFNLNFCESCSFSDFLNIRDLLGIKNNENAPTPVQTSLKNEKLSNFCILFICIILTLMAYVIWPRKNGSTKLSKNKKK
ncbi:unnamed protein product [Brachionus calyciflorus]|uniref:Uncharacterized protein n=1 Tax=Brachionus calyciflorus TaxID=104777 RepID=A0A814HKA6_9BILA|nr:unnamed protein product [Brachionus calyciflorus]